MSWDDPGKYDDDDIVTALGCGEEVFEFLRDAMTHDPVAATALGVAEYASDTAP